MIRPDPDGTLHPDTHVELPMSARRLQASVGRGGIRDIFIWGNGTVGSVSFLSAIPADARQTLLPNRTLFSWDTGSVRITALENLPLFLVEYSGLKQFSVRLIPNRRTYVGLPGSVSKSRIGRTRLFRLPHGNLWCSEFFGTDSGFLLIGAGTEKELSAVLSEVDSYSAAEEVRKASDEHLEWLTSRLETDDSLLGSLFVHALHAAVSSVKHDENGRFAGLSAGYGYALPARTYYRDGYWTVQALLPFFPEIVKEEIFLLARGIQANGEAPSGVIIPTSAGLRYWEARRASDETIARDHRRNSDWWSDHFDSPLFFVLITLEYLQWTGDVQVLQNEVHGRSIGEIVKEIVEGYVRMADGSGIPAKPYHDRDWADNVFRSGFVTYDAALYSGTLELAICFADLLDPSARQKWERALSELRTAARKFLWLPEAGYYSEFVDPWPRHSGLIPRDDHLTLDTITAVRFGLSGKHETPRILTAMSSMLQTRNNHKQPYGDWGLMCTFPHYADHSRLRGKTIFHYRYHNGSDWPYLDSAYAQELLVRGQDDWRYVLSRFWEYSLQNDWPEPVEYYSPTWGKGSPLQSWSSMAAAAMIVGGFRFAPGREPQLPPWECSVLRGVMKNSNCYIISVSGPGKPRSMSVEVVPLANRIKRPVLL